MNELILILVVMIWLLFALIYDLKTREIPDWISYSLIAIALTSSVIASLEQTSFLPLISSLIAAILFAIISLLLYYTKQWGGGDVKLFIALGLALPQYPSSLLQYFNPNINVYFPLILIINLLIAAVIYSLIYLIILIIKNKARFLVDIKKYQMRRLKILFMVVAVIIFISSFLFPLQQSRYLIIIAVLILIFPYIFAITKVIEKIAMIKSIPLSK